MPCVGTTLPQLAPWIPQIYPLASLMTLSCYRKCGNQANRSDYDCVYSHDLPGKAQLTSSYHSLLHAGDPFYQGRLFRHFYNVYFYG